MTALLLSADQRRARRAEAHPLKPVVQIGSDGLTSGLIKETDAALKAHGLIKIRVFSDDRDQRESMLSQLAEALHAAPVQHIGKLLVLWRPIPPKEKTEREDRKPGPKVVKVVSFSKSGNHRATIKKVRVLGNQRMTPAGTLKRKATRQTSVKKKSQT
jgi:putative YhbY family RNA-binding protein